MGMVPVVVVEPAVRAQRDCVRTVLAHAPLRTADELGHIEDAVAVGIVQAVEPRSLRPVADGVKMAADEGEALTVVHPRRDRLPALVAAVAILVDQPGDRPLLDRDAGM